jgi:hypothetical protein
MDKQLPDDFDPTTLVDDESMDPVEQPRERDKANNQDQRTKRDRPDDIEGFMHPWELLRKHIFAGSCCTGVAVLYALSSWDHGWIPGLDSQFALSSDLQKSNQEMSPMKSEVRELVLISIASSIRDLQAEMCTAPSEAKAKELDRLQQRYFDKTGARYPERQRC